MILRRMIFPVFMMAAGLISISDRANAAPCPQCRKILALKTEYNETQNRKDLSHDEAANKITKLIQSVPKKADGRVDSQVVDAVIQILQTDKDRWFRQLFVEKNLTFFKDNRAVFADRLKRLPDNESKAILEDIDIKFKEVDFGNDRKP